jgi:hypothetical protein
MKIDREYLNKIIETLEASEKYVMEGIELLEELSGINLQQEKFIYHLKLLVDANLIEANDFGGFDVNIALLSVRLTLQGHNFVEEARRKAEEAKGFESWDNYAKTVFDTD